MAGPTDLLSQALARHQAGDLAAAEQGYRAVLAQNPRQVKAWKMLGVLERDAGRVAAAIDCLQSALECAGPDARLYFHLGLAQGKHGEWDAAIRSFRLSLTIDERSAEVHNALGRALVERGGCREAADHFSRSVELDPAKVDTHFALAAALAGDQQASAAEAVYRRLLERWSDHVPARSNLGVLLQQQNRLPAALEQYRLALSIDPRCVEAQFNLGSALARTGQLPEATASLRQAVELRPDDPAGHVELGEALAVQGELVSAVGSFTASARLRPGRLAWALKAATASKWIWADREEIDVYRQRLSERLNELHQQRQAFELAELQSLACQPPAALIYQGLDDRPLKEQFARLFTDRLPTSELPRRVGKPRLAFVITPGHEKIFLRGMAGVLNRLDTEKMEIAVTCGAAALDQLTSRIRNADIEKLLLPASLPAAAEALRAGRFDLLYSWEVGTDPLNYFLPLLRTAPVQCTSWGWPVTSGLPRMDYFISSVQLEPAGADAHYSERLIRLEHIPNYYERPNASAVRSDREKFAFGRQHIYFCPQNVRKFHPDFDALVAGILRTDADGLFVMLAGSPACLTDQLLARFARTMPDVVNRVRVMPRMIRGEFQQLLAAADVVLDTPRYGGGANTTYDTLALGKPLVTLEGPLHRGRYAAAVLRQIGVSELIATDQAQYVAIATQLGRQPELNRSLAARVNERAGSLFENRTAVTELEQFFLQAIAASRAS